jgi:predicted aspartyl protease
MGKIIVSVEVSNNGDVIAAERNYMPVSEIKTITLMDVLVDTGATTLCLPKKYIEQLELTVSKEVVVHTALGDAVTNIYNNALLTIYGRSTVVEVIQLHDDATPLLGVIPMEMMGLEVDIIKHELRLLPDHSKDTYLLAY